MKNWSNQSKINENQARNQLEKNFLLILFSLFKFFLFAQNYIELNKGLHIKIYICSIINHLLLIFFYIVGPVLWSFMLFLKIYPCDSFMLIYYLIYNIKII